ncbi:MAG: hypothetical protein GY800_00545 [Planctomycetes bacterium]|nr:hypothetical protein [Planctomycetota bacterium]
MECKIMLNSDEVCFSGEFTISDKYLVERLSLVEERERLETAAQYMTIGARVANLDSNGVAVKGLREAYRQGTSDLRTEVEVFQKVLKENEAGFAKSVQCTLSEFLGNGNGVPAGKLQHVLQAETSNMLKLLDEKLEALKTQFAEDTEGNALDKVQKAVEGQIQLFVRRLSSTSDDNPLIGPLVELAKQQDKGKDDVMKRITDFQTLITSQLQDIIEKVTAKKERLRATRAKGDNYAELLLEETSNVVRMFGDEVENVSNKRGALDEKWGDILVTVNTDETPGTIAKFIIECRDKKMPSLTKLLDELEDHKTNWGAGAGIMVCAHTEQLPKGTGVFNWYSKNRILCVLDKDDLNSVPFEVACKLARILAIQGASVTSQDDVPWNRLKDLVSKLSSQLDEYASVRKPFEAAKKDLDKGIGALEKYNKGFCDVLDEISSLLNSASA